MTNWALTWLADCTDLLTEVLTTLNATNHWQLNSSESLWENLHLLLQKSEKSWNMSRKIRKYREETDSRWMSGMGNNPIIFSLPARYLWLVYDMEVCCCRNILHSKLTNNKIYGESGCKFSKLSARDECEGWVKFSNPTN